MTSNAVRFGLPRFVVNRNVRWEEQEQVRQVPYTVQRIEYDERVEQVPVRTCRYVSETKTGLVRDSRAFSEARFSCRELERFVGIALEWMKAVAKGLNGG